MIKELLFQLFCTLTKPFSFPVSWAVENCYFFLLQSRKYNSNLIEWYHKLPFFSSYVFSIFRKTKRPLENLQSVYILQNCLRVCACVRSAFIFQDSVERKKKETAWKDNKRETELREVPISVCQPFRSRIGHEGQAQPFSTNSKRKWVKLTNTSKNVILIILISRKIPISVI